MHMTARGLLSMIVAIQLGSSQPGICSAIALKQCCFHTPFKEQMKDNILSVFQENL